MAACGGIEQIFEKPLPESQNFLEALSAWKHVKGLKSNNSVDESSFTELFGELHFKETPSSSSSSSSLVGDIERGRGGYYPPSGRRKHNQSFSSDCLSLCTEGLGFESFDDVEETSSHEEFCCGEVGRHGDGERTVARESEKQRGDQATRASRAAFPPPISCIGRSGKPWVWFKSYREDGRFILKEIRIPTQEFLHACREDGRLQLRFVQSDDEEEAVGEEDEIEAEAVDDQDEL